jgi:hypothetical protein
VGEVEAAAVPEAVRDGLGYRVQVITPVPVPGQLNFFSTERPWVPPSKTREKLPLEYLVTRATHVPAGTPEQAIQDVRAREAVGASELAPLGYLLRPGQSPLVPGKWRARELVGQATGR